jgi:hypothetical protein
MKYIFGINESGEAKQLATAISPYNEVVTQDYYPAREYRPGYRAVLKYDVEQGIYWDYVLIPASEKREHAYETYKCIPYGDALLTVDEANKLWQEYEAEGSSLAPILTGLIATAKAQIREMYPDGNLENEESETVEPEIEESDDSENIEEGGNSNE